MIFGQIATLVAVMIAIHLVARIALACQNYCNCQAVVYISAHHEVYDNIEMSELVYDALTTDAEADLVAALVSPVGEGKTAAFEVLDLVESGWQTINAQIITQMSSDDLTRIPLRVRDKSLIESRHKEWRTLQQKITDIKKYHEILRVTDIYS